VTLQIELFLTPSYCIEAVTKREYWKNVDEYLKQGKEDRALEEKIELLRYFLGTADFTASRGQTEKFIAAGKRGTFFLTMKEGRPYCTMTIDK